MASPDLHIVTGAFGYTGRHIASLLLERGSRVRTLTGHPDRPSPFGDRVEAIPLHFDRPELLAEGLRGAVTVFNTYWVRLERGQVTFDRAVANTRALTRAAVEAGVRRFVHISVTNASLDSPLPYFRGKALAEQALIESGLSYAIVRPTVLFGHGDVLFNNIAWLLRRLPVFAMFGSGQYRLQPVCVGDVAALAAELAERTENVVVDAAGPEMSTFDELVRLIRRRVGSQSLLMHVPATLGYAATRVMGLLLRDVVITRDEIAGLMANLLVSTEAPRCATRFSEWLARHAGQLGVTYASELQRHYRG